MSTYLPSLSDFFPPTPRAYDLQLTAFKYFPLVTTLQWLFPSLQLHGKTSSSSRLFNLPGRLAWCLMEGIGPLNLIYIMLTLPSKLLPPSSIAQLPFWNKAMAALYIVHYIQRAFISPVFLAPSISPMHVTVAVFMGLFNFVNSECLGGWLAGYYSSSAARTTNSSSAPSSSTASSVLPYIGLVIFFLGMAGNIAAENTLFSLRRGAAKRKARSEGKAEVTYDKVYVIPPAEGLFKYILYPHYVLEWVEWFGFCLVGYGAGVGEGSCLAAWLFLMNAIANMTPRAVSGRPWYEKKFGKRAVGVRGAVVPGGWL